ncbi:hypothetical protein T310_1224 [Rasamsonia emersonii CBS 393.64]|uniref:Uncharacterized protein n=1 Tax=Rasamsonia emersonii (strain ATCC 16479 / CBS 393.64 / IMI 116815) TaxID=1408163 RepID=A0A0F4Z2L6_RASE3|nr:hypothetical protein T310_1224 [Rasamsonia emersonii CBS 393.64]KKA24759.1 hypothetical protein T310_1224 [Rasamsonia emersonii CBS 393.64]
MANDRSELQQGAIAELQLGVARELVTLIACATLVGLDKAKDVRAEDADCGGTAPAKAEKVEIQGSTAIPRATARTSNEGPVPRTPPSLKRDTADCDAGRGRPVHESRP